MSKVVTVGGGEISAPERKSVIYSLPQDKPKIVFHAAMMAIQNFGFMVLYNSTWAATPHAEVCDSTRYAVGLMSMTCFLVAFLCVGMGFGGYTDDKPLFFVMWYLHLVGGSLYTASTVIIPVARYSDDGNKCADLAPTNGERVNAIWIMHASLYMVYVGGMLSITYFSFLKNLLADRKLPHPGLILLVVLLFGGPQAIVYATQL